MDFADTNKDSGVSLNEFCALVKTINEAAMYAQWKKCLVFSF